MPRAAKTTGRGVGALLADFGHDLPTRPRPDSTPGRGRLFRPVPLRGRRGRGWSPASAPVSVWRMTADQAPALWPWVASPALPHRGAQMGIDLFSVAGA